LAIASSDHYTCRLISPSVVLEHRLDGEDLAWVRDHLRRCEACRERVDVFRERLLRVQGPALPTTPGLLASVRLRGSAIRERAAHSRRYATVALMVLLLAGLFVSSSPRFAAGAVKAAPVSSTLVDTGSAGVTRPSTVPSPSATPEPSALPAISQAGTVPSVVVPSAHPAPSRPPAPTPAPVAAAPPRVHLTVTPLSGLAPLTVIANAAGSTSANGIASYAFDFGDGTPRVLGATASHTYCRVGHYQLSVTVTDSAGLHSTAYWPVDVTPQDPPATSC
jgi:PKD domain-containing protein